MGRKKKYGKKAEIVTLCLDPIIIEILDNISESAKVSRSELMNTILTSYGRSKVDYARAMAKHHNAEFHYWKYQLDLWSEEE